MKNQWVLHDPVTGRYYNYANSQVNHFNEWNPSKIGWMKTREAKHNHQGQFLLPPPETLSRFFEINCEKNKATFHGVQNATNLDRHGGFTLLKYPT